MLYAIYTLIKSKLCPQFKFVNDNDIIKESEIQKKIVIDLPNTSLDMKQPFNSYAYSNKEYNYFKDDLGYLYLHKLPTIEENHEFSIEDYIDLY